MKKRNLLKLMLCAFTLLPLSAWGDEVTIGTTKTWTFDDLTATTQYSSYTNIDGLYLRTNQSGRSFTVTAGSATSLTFADGYTINVTNYLAVNSNATYSGDDDALTATSTAGDATNRGRGMIAINATVAGTFYVKIKGGTSSKVIRAYFANGTSIVGGTETSVTSDGTIQEISYTSAGAGSFFVGGLTTGNSEIYAARFVPTEITVSEAATWTFNEMSTSFTTPNAVVNKGDGLYVRGASGRNVSFSAVAEANKSREFSDGTAVTCETMAAISASTAGTNATEASSANTNMTPSVAFKTTVPGTIYAIMQMDAANDGNRARMYYCDGENAPVMEVNETWNHTNIGEIKKPFNKVGSFFIGSNNSSKIYAVRFVPESVTPPTIENHNGTITITHGVSTVGATVKTYYTTNGTTPTSSSNEYTAPFSQTSAATIKAITISQSSASTASDVSDSKDVPTIPTALSSNTMNFAGLGTGDVTVDDDDNFNVNTTNKTYAPKDADLSALYINDVIFSYSRTGATITLGANYLLLDKPLLTITIPGLTAGDIVTLLSCSNNNSQGVTFACSSGGEIISGATNSPAPTPNYIVVKSTTDGNMVLTTADRGLCLYNITVTDGIELTETNGLTPYNGVKDAEVKMSFSRTFSNGKASTVCLPFDMTAPASSVGTFATFTGVDMEGEEVTYTAVVAGASLTAGTPYLFIPATGDEITFSNSAYTIPEEGFTAAGTTSQDAWHFKGTYTNLTWSAGQTVLYGLASSDFVATGGESVEVGDFVRFNSGTTPSFRAYMYYGESDPTPSAREFGETTSTTLPESMKVVLVGLNGETTDIGRIPVVYESKNWYTLDGRRLNGKPSAKGLYINNGRKVLVK